MPGGASTAGDSGADEFITPQMCKREVRKKEANPRIQFVLQVLDIESFLQVGDRHQTDSNDVSRVVRSLRRMFPKILNDAVDNSRQPSRRQLATSRKENHWQSTSQCH